MVTYMGGIRGSGVLSSTDDVLETRVVRGVGGVCDMCMCLARGGMGGVGGEWRVLPYTNYIEVVSILLHIYRALLP